MARPIGDGEHVLRIASGEEAKAAILRFADDSGIEAAHVEAIGALREVWLRYWNAERREYEDHELREQLEVLSLTGNLGHTDDGSLKLHLHAVLGRRDLGTVGGHVARAIAHPTLEVFVRPVHVELRRSKDAASGLDLLELPVRAEERVEEEAR